MARFALEQNILDFAVAVQIPFRIGLPVSNHHLTLDDASFSGVGSNVPDGVVNVHNAFLGRFFVEENEGNVSSLGFFNNGTGSGRINKVDGQSVNTTVDEYVNLVI